MAKLADDGESWKAEQIIQRTSKNPFGASAVWEKNRRCKKGNKSGYMGENEHLMTVRCEGTLVGDI